MPFQHFFYYQFVGYGRVLLNIFHIFIDRLNENSNNNRHCALLNFHFTIYELAVLAKYKLITRVRAKVRITTLKLYFRIQIY